MPTQAEVVRNYQSASRRIRDRIESYARRAWVSLDTYRDADIDRLVELVVPQVLAGQRTIAQLTDAYLGALSGVVPGGVDERVIAAPRGVAPDEVYRRPGITVWTALSEGATPSDAIAAGLARLVSLAVTDLELAQRAQEQVSLRRGGHQFYRRVLTGSENCMLCAVASTQRYFVGDLKPIHPGCDCDVAPILSGSDPGQILNEELLEQAHESVGARFGANDRGARALLDEQGREIEYKDILVREHGEYGPTLTWRKDKFTGPADIAA